MVTPRCCLKADHRYSKNLIARVLSLDCTCSKKRGQRVDKGIKKLHEDFYETTTHEQSYKMQMKGQGKMATEKKFLKEHKST